MLTVAGGLVRLGSRYRSGSPVSASRTFSRASSGSEDAGASGGGGRGRPASSACRHDILRAIVSSQPLKAAGSLSSPIDAQALRKVSWTMSSVQAGSRTWP